MPMEPAMGRGEAARVFISYARSEQDSELTSGSHEVMLTLRVCQDRVGRPMRVFVSYARNDLDGGELDRFLEELGRDLKATLGDKAEVLFRDLKDLRLG